MAVRKLFIPKEVFYGWGAVEALRNWPVKRAFIVTDMTMVRQGHVEKVEKLLREAGYEADVYSDVEPEPSRETIQRGARRAVEFRPDVIVGLGGGSCIDAGKVVRLFYEHPQLMELSWADLGPGARSVTLGQKASYVAIPTTSGTGSEASPMAILSNQESTPPVKVRVLNMGNLPDMAICDPQFPFTMPPNVTADTGFDAFVHAIECFIVNRPSEIVDALAVKAFQTVHRWLPKAVHNGQDKEARERMHMAATLAGIAACNGSTGMVHDMAHQIGGAFHVAHGRSNALVFDVGLGYYFPKAGGRFLEAAEAMGLRPRDERDAAVRLFSAVMDLKKEIGLPLTMSEAGIQERQYLELLDIMATNVPALALRPSAASHEEIRTLFVKAWKTELL